MRSADSRDGAVETVIVPRTSELTEGFTVRRALPSKQRRMVGPFVFLDEMGPALLEPGRGLDVRPHPHIGLATVTYLFEGEVLHRDSLGTVQPIRPGEVNWMTAGAGIAHSERTPPEARRHGSRLWGIQMWVALPRAQERCEAAFTHYDASALPEIEGDGARMRLIAGSLHGVRSPVVTHSETLYADVSLTTGGRFEVTAEQEERALYVVAGSVEIRGVEGSFDAGQLVVLAPGHAVVLRACAPDTRLMVLGGAAMDGPRHIWWNFVSSSPEQITQAQIDWREGRFAPVPDEDDRIPLPETPAPPVRYP